MHTWYKTGNINTVSGRLSTVLISKGDEVYHSINEDDLCEDMNTTIMVMRKGKF